MEHQQEAGRNRFNTILIGMIGLLVVILSGLVAAVIISGKSRIPSNTSVSNTKGHTQPEQKVTQARQKKQSGITTSVPVEAHSSTGNFEDARNSFALSTVGWEEQPASSSLSYFISSNKKMSLVITEAGKGRDPEAIARQSIPENGISFEKAEPAGTKGVRTSLIKFKNPDNKEYTATAFFFYNPASDSIWSITVSALEPSVSLELPAVLNTILDTLIMIPGTRVTR